MCDQTIKTYKNTRHILIEFLSISIYRAVIRRGVGSEGGEEGEREGTQTLTPSKPSTPRLLVFLHTSCPSSSSRTPVFLPPLSLSPNPPLPNALLYPRPHPSEAFYILMPHHPILSFSPRLAHAFPPLIPFLLPLMIYHPFRFPALLSVLILLLLVPPVSSDPSLNTHPHSSLSPTLIPHSSSIPPIQVLSPSPTLFPSTVTHFHPA